MMNNFSGAKFAFAKLVVNDLVKMDAFYRSICEYPEGQWVSNASPLARSMAR